MSRRKAKLEIAALVIAVVSPALVAHARRPGPFGRRKSESALNVTVTPNETARRVDVTVGGAPFTSYIWPERLRKPVLYPIRSAIGTLVTRGWPLDPRPGER